jgi:hypothetical protein
MMFSPKSPWLLAALGVLTLACEPGGVGDPCIPEDEYNPSFPGFAQTEANTEIKSFQCVTRVCLANHFRGRASCPYGQSQTQADNDPQCFIPGTDDKIVVAVDPQFEARQTDRAVYCSCRCDGPDPNARYCECPSGYTCADLVPDLNLGKGQLAGSYCSTEGTEFNPEATSVACSRAQKNCEQE